MLKGRLGRIFFLMFLVLLLAAGYIYFFQISPSFVTRPQIEKPLSIGKGQAEFDFLHFSYVLNELDAYKLHADIITNELPIIELYLEDTGETLYAQVRNNKITETKDTDADLRISADKAAMLELFEGDTEKVLLKKISDGTIRLEVISDEKTLALKGYKSIYDKLSKDRITGNIVGRLNPLGILRGMEIFLFILFALTVSMILEKEI